MSAIKHCARRERVQCRGSRGSCRFDGPWVAWPDAYHAHDEPCSLAAWNAIHRPGARAPAGAPPADLFAEVTL